MIVRLSTRPKIFFISNLSQFHLPWLRRAGDSPPYRHRDPKGRGCVQRLIKGQIAFMMRMANEQPSG